jgi:hypothetical protein
MSTLSELNDWAVTRVPQLFLAQDWLLNNHFRSRNRSDGGPYDGGVYGGGFDDYGEYDDGSYYDGPYADYDLSEYAY